MPLDSLQKVLALGLHATTSDGLQAWVLGGLPTSLKQTEVAKPRCAVNTERIKGYQNNPLAIYISLGVSWKIYFIAYFESTKN